MKRKFTSNEQRTFAAQIGLESPGLRVVRALLVLIVSVGASSALLAFLEKDVAEIRTHQSTWLVGVLVIGICISIWFDKRTKLSAYARQFHAEYNEGMAEVVQFEVVDSIRMKELEDNGYAFYLKLTDGKVLFLMGQYLYEQTDKGQFPSTSVEIAYSPTSRFVLSCIPMGDYLPPSFEMMAPSLKDVESGKIPEDGAILNQDFDEIRTLPANRRTC